MAFPLFPEEAHKTELPRVRSQAIEPTVIHTSISLPHRTSDLREAPGPCYLGIHQASLSIQSLVILLLTAMSGFTVWKREGNKDLVWRSRRHSLWWNTEWTHSKTGAGWNGRIGVSHVCPGWGDGFWIDGCRLGALSLSPVFGSLGGAHPFYPPRFIFLHELINAHSDHTKESWNLTLPLFIFFFFFF